MEGESSTDLPPPARCMDIYNVTFIVFTSWVGFLCTIKNDASFSLLFCFFCFLIILTPRCSDEACILLRKAQKAMFIVSETRVWSAHCKQVPRGMWGSIAYANCRALLSGCSGAVEINCVEADSRCWIVWTL